MGNPIKGFPIDLSKEQSGMRLQSRKNPQATEAVCGFRNQFFGQRFIVSFSLPIDITLLQTQHLLHS